MRAAALQDYLADAARQRPQAVAVVEPGHGEITYRELDALANRVRDRLLAWGVRRGDRVGLCMRKSIDALAVIYGALKAGAAYVPVDAGAPAARCAYILHDCAVAALFVDAAITDRLRGELEALGALPPVLTVERAPGEPSGLTAALRAADTQDAAAAGATVTGAPDDLAYVLYTSGSTGKPKGVMLTQRNAVSFVDWCSQTFAPTPDDRFSSHAPFHFDLSILDIHLCFKHAATLVLVAEEIGKDAPRLAQLIAEQRISVWYSAPSILALLAQFGDLARHPVPQLRSVLFAGEVFAVKHLRVLTTLWPQACYYNLYGPTETNVCTWHEVALPVPPERSTPYPIGRTCSHLRSRVLDGDGADVAPGAEGELCIAGDGVMQGYWSLPEQTARAFHRDAAATPWYRTGDIVSEDGSGCYTYLGRRDRMVKRRGYRVELGEIEAGLYGHPRVEEAAVVAHADDEAGITITAFLSSGQTGHPSLIEIKRFCAENLPLYMIPDKFVWLDRLPKTSTDKLDYQRMKEMR